MPSRSATRQPLGPWTLLTGVGGGLALALGGVMASPTVALAAIAGAAATAFLLSVPQAAFLSTVFVIPIERLGRLTPDSAMYTISLMRIVGVVALGSYLLHAALRRWRVHVEAPLLAYAAYVVLAVLGVTHSTDRLGTVRACGALLGNLLFFFLVTNMVRDWRTGWRAIQVWVLSVVLVCIYTTYSWHTGGGVAETDVGDLANRFGTILEDTSEYQELDTVARATGPTSHAAVYAINLIMSIPFFFVLWRTAATRWVRALLAAGLGLVLYNVLLTNTRAAILLAALVIVLCAATGLLRVTAGALLGGVVAVALLLPFVPDAVYERVLDPSNYSYTRSGTLRIRLQYWEAGLLVARQHWLTGMGVGNQQEVPRLIKGDAPPETTVHNEFLMTFMEVGLPGWLLFFGFVAAVTAAAGMGARRIRRAEGRSSNYWLMVGSLIAMVSVLLFGLQVDVFHFPLKGWWLIAGMSWVAAIRLATPGPAVEPGEA